MAKIITIIFSISVNIENYLISNLYFFHVLKHNCEFFLSLSILYGKNMTKTLFLELSLSERCSMVAVAL